MTIGAVGTPTPTLPMGDVTAIGKPRDPAEAAKDRAEASKLKQQQVLDQVREKGLYQWAQETRFEKLKEKIREQIMAERGLDAAGVDALSDDQRNSLEQEISKRVQEVMQEAMSGEAKAAQAEGRPPKPMIIDISV